MPYMEAATYAVEHDEPVLVESEQGVRWMMPISYCACCDEGCDPLDVPDKACGCSVEQRRTTSVEVMPVSEHEAAVSQTPLLDARKMTIDEYKAALLKERDR